ncbi:putative adenylyl cyclase CyaB [Candidatus Micrarchaeum sp.]|jgi:predicted adenylyl cyclase CyaB|uniref:class IV adenylate cyclase n=1 Tax=Candidatus Micrarchaeum sp. TaxID=2282148 RepID=UPI00092841A2|nr:CYTH domain-containing protein [Candidatus Micrarchaeum sp.]OJT94792.1 MAG: hypothetical protein JJ59_01825 [Candidatus Micrarchaeum sp. AZ1]OWP53647.1 MAG: hypothetical protein B2I19_01705 [Thermoplasmatales archaeon ARMAN]QRF74301.1 putative adenylyl cyclase CyaB [Candidatus Micrarchaeum sp.]
MEEKRVQEVEKRALLNGSEYEAVKNKLITLGASNEGVVNINDTYFCRKDTKSFSEIEMKEVGSFSLRLREQSAADKPKETMMNVKVITRQNDHNSWEEHEILVGSMDEATAILKAIGFKPFCTIKKKRLAYTLEGVSISLENIEDFGLGIEAEIMATKDKEDSAKAKIDEVLSEIGIGSSKVVEKSITNIIMREKAKF